MNNLETIKDVSVELSVQLASRRMSVKDVLSLGEGSIVPFDQNAGEPVLILINDRPVARGEVISVDNDYGVRVTELLGQRCR